MTIYARSGKLYVNYLDENGVRARKATGLKDTKENRAKLQAKAALALAKNPTKQQEARGFSIAEVIEAKLKECIGLKDSTKKSMLSAYKTIFKAMELKESTKIGAISKSDVALFYQACLAANFSKGTINMLASRLNGLLTFAVDNEMLAKNPFFKMQLKTAKPPEKILPLNLEEIKAVLNACSDTRLKTFLTVAFFTGARMGELLVLSWGDVDFENDKITISKTLSSVGSITPPKTASSDRIIDMLPVVKSALIEYSNTEQGMGSFLFIESLPVNLMGFNRAWHALLKTVGLSRRKLYTTRHTFASLMLQRGEEPLWVSAMLGHKNLDITYKTYAHYLPRKEVERATFLKEF